VLALLLRRYAIGILPRYVIGQVLKSFLLALVTMTAVFVLVMVFAEATKLGLTPQDISRLVPYLIPSTLPYTIPVSLLFAVSVVYGRLAGDNEIVAVKAAGQSVLSVLTPTLVLAASISVGLFVLNSEAIPRCNRAIKDMLYRNFEDFFFKKLRKSKEFNDTRFPYVINVKDVKDNILIEAAFQHRVKDLDRPIWIDSVAYAERAEVHFDLKAGVIRLTVDKAQFIKGGDAPQFGFINEHTLELPLPHESKEEPKVQELTTLELDARLSKRQRMARHERPRQAAKAALLIAAGQLGEVKWPQLRETISNQKAWENDAFGCETEKHTRVSLGLSAFFFVLLGAPVGILFARRDFLSAFITSFLPIILIYYPLTLLGMNLGKEGTFSPVATMAAGNVALAALAGLFALPPVLRH
jgi:lipopolysaccharide export system permease protein